MSHTDYDSVPYASFAYAQTHITHLFTLGRLFGLQPADFKRARVLELGCASGGNLIPVAAEFPEASFLGIDLSSKQIADGQKIIAEAGLTNIQLKTQSISDFDGADGPFDYIICHGVYSWVPADVPKVVLSP